MLCYVLRISHQTLSPWHFAGKGTDFGIVKHEPDVKQNTVSKLKSVYLVAGWVSGSWALLTAVWCLSAQGTQKESSNLGQWQWPQLPIILTCASLLPKLPSIPSLQLQKWLIFTSFIRCNRPLEVEQKGCDSQLPQHITSEADLIE